MRRKKPLTVPEAWDVIHDWMRGHSPTLLPKLNKPASKAALADLEKSVGLVLAEDFKASYLIHDGADPYSGPLVGVPFMSLARIVKEWKTLKPKRGSDYPSLKAPVSCPRLMVKEVGGNARWVPFAGPDEQNYIGLDFDPGPKGTAGQVINFGANQFIYGSNRFVFAPSFGGFMNFLADLFATGQVEVCPDNDPSDQRFLQLTRRRETGASCSLLTGLGMLLGNGDGT
jgi:cell wall assembly regulator SMI1